MTAPTPGVPIWVDLGTADPADATSFYTELFGWTAHVSGEQYGGYTVFNLRGRPVAGAGPLFGEAQPTAWSTYVATDDADAVASRVAAAGGKVLVPPFNVMEQGRMAAFLDRTGAAFSVWEPGTMLGAEVFDVPGALTWTELVTRDVDGSAAFYRSVFGWTARPSPMVGGRYCIWQLDGQTIAGMQPMDGPGWPDDLSPHWMIYFAVADCDETVALAQDLGGRVIGAPETFPMGRYAVLQDPQGGTFSVLAGQD